MMPDFSPKSREGKRQSNDIFKGLGGKSVHLAKISRNSESKIKTFLDFFKLRLFVYRRLESREVGRKFIKLKEIDRYTERGNRY